MTGMMLIEDGYECGLGRGADCCAFLTAGREGFMCGRTNDSIRIQIYNRLLEGTMNAEYDPGDAPFPECQPGRAS